MGSIIAKDEKKYKLHNSEVYKLHNSEVYKLHNSEVRGNVLRTQHSTKFVFFIDLCFFIVLIQINSHDRSLIRIFTGHMLNSLGCAG